MTTLTQAHNQWSRRAPDERYSSLADIHAAAVAARERAVTGKSKLASIRAIEDNGAVAIEGSSGQRAALSHWAFGQLATKAEAPASYLRTLPASLAVANLNHGLAAVEDCDAAILLNREHGAFTARAITSQKYDRIWNADITRRLQDMEATGPWQPAPAAFDGSRGLYLSDQDMFCFLVDNERRIFETLPGGGVSRGFFVSNSEVGAGSFVITTFFYEYVCGNHRVWGASGVKEFRIRHVGDANGAAFREMRGTLIEYANASADEDEARIERARNMELGSDKDAVLDAIFKMRSPLLTRKLASEAYTLAENRVDWYGNPRSVWGMVGAITEIARDKPNASERDALQRAGSKLLEVAF
jgi:hypothetical protein